MTTAGRVFCILFAIVGIPFTLSVIADVGQVRYFFEKNFIVLRKMACFYLIDICDFGLCRLEALQAHHQASHQANTENGES